MMEKNAMEPHPSIDWPLSIKLANNNEQLAKEILEIFINDLATVRDSIHHTYQQKQYAELFDHVHRLHGATCYCGAVRLRMLLEVMEGAVKSRLYSQFEKLLGDLDNEVNSLLATNKTVESA